jgi:transcriptional regulator with XRE-family HTH domain
MSNNILLAIKTTLWGMNKSAKQILAGNLEALMERDGYSQSKLAAKAQKIGGSKVAQTTISNMLNPNSTISPKIDSIEAIAAVWKLQAWQLLHPTLGDAKAAEEVLARFASAPKKDQNLIYQILEMDPVSDARVSKHIPSLKSNKTR